MAARQVPGKFHADRLQFHAQCARRVADAVISPISNVHNLDENPVNGKIFSPAFEAGGFEFD
jgi:hypothetical protein